MLLFQIFKDLRIYWGTSQIESQFLTFGIWTASKNEEKLRRRRRKEKLTCFAPSKKEVKDAWEPAWEDFLLRLPSPSSPDGVLAAARAKASRSAASRCLILSFSRHLFKDSPKTKPPLVPAKEWLKVGKFVVIFCIPFGVHSLACVGARDLHTM